MLPGVESVTSTRWPEPMAMPNPKFEQSYERLFGATVALQESSDEFFSRFYARFLSADDVAALFQATDMQQQVQMLKRSLVHLAGFYVTGEVSGELARIAGIHRRLQVKPEMFEQWLQALVDTVVEFDPEADEETRLAWCWAMAPGITYMRLVLSGALAPPTHQ